MGIIDKILEKYNFSSGDSGAERQDAPPHAAENTPQSTPQDASQGTPSDAQRDSAYDREYWAEQNLKWQELFAKNHEYRLALQKYGKNLKEKELSLIAREEALTKREASVEDRMREKLKDKELSLAEREEDLAKREAVIGERVKANIRKTVLAALEQEKEKLQNDIQFAREQLSGLQDMEYKIIDWASGVEKKERGIMDELLADAGKYQKFKIPCDGYDFENYVANLLQENAFKSVQVTPKSNDYGADITAEKDGVNYVFQCKYYTNQVGISAVQEVYSAKSHYGAHVAVVVTNSVYTKAAKVLAHELNVVLWDCKKLFELTQTDQPKGVSL